MNLSSPRVVQELLQRHGLKPNHSLGQNFLVDRNYLEKIVAAADVRPGDTVLEIGPGLGTLTAALAERGADVLAIEKDRHLQPLLAETLSGLAVQLTWADALQVDYRALLSGATSPKVVANLPYYVTTPLIVGLLCSEVPWRNLVFLVQREVVERVLAKPGQKTYGLLGIVAQYYTKPTLVTTVPAKAFYPPPKVASAVLQLQPIDPTSYGLKTDAAELFGVAKAALGQRRKTLLNALTAATCHSRVVLQQVLADLGWAPERRGETLTIPELVELTNHLHMLDRH